jgi:hypothetical protein
LGKNSDHSHIGFFQSLKRFREQGLPHDLPARLEADLNLDLQLCELRDNLHKLKLGKGSATTLQEAERRAASYYKKLYRVRLREYQRNGPRVVEIGRFSLDGKRYPVILARQIWSRISLS